jgi:hypothetical protein
MKKIIYLFIFISLLLINISCQEKTEEYGQPSIFEVTTTTKSEAITTAALNDWITVSGTNFYDIEQILLNDISLKLNDVYISQNEITFQIPRKLPEDVNNLITIITPQGNASQHFVIKTPELLVKGLSNEFTLPGDSVIILGDNFDLYKFDTTMTVNFGELESLIYKVEKEKLYVKVPDKTPDETVVSITNPLSKEKVKVLGLYRDTRSYQIMTFDNKGFWTNTNLTAGPDSLSINGKYFHFKGKTTFNYMIHFTPNELIKDKSIFNSQNITKYQLKFEILTFQPYGKTFFSISFAASPANVVYLWKPAPFDTQKEWKTVTIDLDNWDFSSTTTINNNMYINLQSTTAEDQDFCLDNFRIVPKD